MDIAGDFHLDAAQLMRPPLLRRTLRHLTTARENVANVKANPFKIQDKNLTKTDRVPPDPSHHLVFSRAVCSAFYAPPFSFFKITFARLIASTSQLMNGRAVDHTQDNTGVSPVAQ